MTQIDAFSGNCRANGHLVRLKSPAVAIDHDKRQVFDR
jgi:hypothetical protein